LVGICIANHAASGLVIGNLPADRLAMAKVAKVAGLSGLFDE
jgi:hypothetical protein